MFCLGWVGYFWLIHSWLTFCFLQLSNGEAHSTLSWHSGGYSQLRLSRCSAFCLIVVNMVHGSCLTYYSGVPSWVALVYYDIPFGGYSLQWWVYQVTILDLSYWDLWVAFSETCSLGTVLSMVLFLHRYWRQVHWDWLGLLGMSIK